MKTLKKGVRASRRKDGYVVWRVVVAASSLAGMALVVGTSSPVGSIVNTVLMSAGSHWN